MEASVVTEESKQQRSLRPRDGRSRLLLLLFCAVVGLVSGVVASVLWASRKHRTDSTSITETEVPLDVGSYTDMIDGNPTANATTLPKEDSLLQFLKFHSFDSGLALSNERTPQYAAYEWLKADRITLSGISIWWHVSRLAMSRHCDRRSGDRYA